MATNQRNKKGAPKSGSANQPSRQQPREATTMSQMRDQVAEYYERGEDQVRSMTRDHEGSAVLIALAAGFGVGVLIGCAMAPAKPRSSRWIDRTAAENLGRRFLERFEGMVPEMISERFGR
jgi:hypothetical protein